MRINLLCLLSLIAIFSPALSQSQGFPKPEPRTLPLECAASDCPLLTGAPETAGLRSGYVRLKPGESVGWHTTAHNEETLVILHGKGELLIEGRSALPIAERMTAYVPPSTRHNVAASGSDVLEYVYVVAPADTQGTHSK